MVVTWVKTPEELREVARTKIARTNRVLDVGTGIYPQSFFRPSVHICVDAHLPYLEHLQAENRPNLILLHNTWRPALAQFTSKSVDSVFALDFIEHLTKSDGIAFLEEARRIACRQVVIFTPLGFYPQCYDDPEKIDHWGLKGGHWQTHQSGWGIEDFTGDWELICCAEYHFTDQDHQPLDKPIGAIWGILNLDPTLNVSTDSAGSQLRIRAGVALQRVKRLIPPSVRAWLRTSLSRIRR